MTTVSSTVSSTALLSSECIAGMTLYELKVQCKKRKLMLSGNKQDLIDRLLGKKNKTRERIDVLKSELEIISHSRLDDEDQRDKNDVLAVGLLLAAKHGFIYAANHFVNRGAKNFDDAMKLAARYGNKHIVEFCKHRGRVTEFDEAMALAARHGHKEIVTLCKVSGAKDFNTAMACAAQGGHIKIVRKCKKWGATNVDYTMCCAGSGGKVRILKQCVQWGASNRLLNATMKNAAANGHLNVVKKCKKYGATRFDFAVKSALLNDQIEILELFDSWKVIDTDIVDKVIERMKSTCRWSDERERRFDGILSRLHAYHEQHVSLFAA